MAWQPRAACKGLPQEIFFPPEGLRGRSLSHREDDAKRICHSCPVIDACRAHALDTAEPHGVWGATTPIERQRLIQARIRARTSMAPMVGDVLPPRGIRR
ncbi:MAG: WhiB family transcriptional regulator [Mycobacterium sp.]